MTTSRTGGQILVDQLITHGVQQLFCVPGESFLAVLDALHDASIDVTVCRQEGGAAMMAEAQGKLTGQPGICFVTRGPGATNASAGVHIAHQDSTPMILFVGQVGRGMVGREAFQELDYSAVFGTMAKWVVQIDDPARVPELISRAFHVATSGRPGPVVIALPEDMLTEAASVADALPYAVTETHPGTAQMAELAQRLQAAKQPVAILGGSRWSEQAVREFTAFAEAWSLPVYCSFRRQMLFPASHACYGGDLGLGANPKLLARIKASDLVLMVGGRLSEVPSQGYE
ncbi:MAG: thiamine pyrophosphate-binding protein, partial [Burkholderiaceae bacterium]|nr:thiamine pyrophosphate-binding protein [Burkholderiaceae bacterium]